MEQMLEQARNTLQMEADAILELVPRVDEHFSAAVAMILDCPGRVVITGMGKSGIIGRKMAATFASTGTPSFYLHPAEGIHGDLGMVTESDVVIALSNSGETGEVLHILPSLRRIGAKLIAMVGNAESSLAKNSDITLDVGVSQEACPLGLAPTSSTTAALAYGDALALALLSKRKFTASQFAVFHPGGSLGRKLLLTVEDIMHSGADNPVVNGTPSFYLHPAEGIHGDLGMVTESDVVIALSNSGETGEVLHILPSLRRIGAKLIAMVGNAESSLAKNSDITLDVGVSQEACPLGLAPTSSTTAALAYGDALALALLSKRKFTASQFAVFHPGGSLGRKLLLTVEDIMHSGADNPVVNGATTVQDALFVITDKGLGAVSVVDDNEIMIGVLTDGDIRRGLSKGIDFLQRPVTELMTRAPKTITKDKLAAQALHLMESNSPKPITVLPVIDEERRVIGLLHMTDLVRQGVV